MKVNPLIFREYDVRGVFPRDLDDETVYNLGRAFGTKVAQQGGKSLILGRDIRLSSEHLRDVLANGLNDVGISLHDLGVVPTPLVYFAISYFSVDGGVMITGSHNPPEYNGFKMNLGQNSIYGEEIQELRALMEAEDFVQPPAAGTIRKENIIPAYSEYLRKNLVIDQPIRLVLDCGNGTAGLVAPELFRSMGCLVEVLYGEPDGTFPNHHPDPTVVDNMQDLIRRTEELGYDLGVAYDGDADRIGVVDDLGNILWGDQLMIIFSRAILKRNPGGVIIGEVKCSQNLYLDVSRHGGKPIMWRTGHSLIKKKMREENALLAGEMSGHIFFNDRYFGFDDAIYASGRLVELLCQEARPLSQLLSGLPKTYVSPEIRLDVPDEVKFDLVDQVKQYFMGQQYEVIDVDGVRVTFPDGWGLVRASNTQPAIVMRFEAQSEPRLQEIRALIEGKLKEYQQG
ncbi:MAG: phosphomannomutase/phosphoglucomutase [Candidatus Zixiibacteriota bacterium]|nr:MAG: phosphomannomutase/phosphoglucomutase [candidate division Zixibacteria bacterium]